MNLKEQFAQSRVADQQILSLAKQAVADAERAVMSTEIDVSEKLDVERLTEMELAVDKAKRLERLAQRRLDLHDQRWIAKHREEIEARRAEVSRDRREAKLFEDARASVDAILKIDRQLRKAIAGLRATVDTYNRLAAEDAELAELFGLQCDPSKIDVATISAMVSSVVQNDRDQAFDWASRHGGPKRGDLPEHFIMSAAPFGSVGNVNESSQRALDMPEYLYSRARDLARQMETK